MVVNKPRFNNSATIICKHEPNCTQPRNGLDFLNWVYESIYKVPVVLGLQLTHDGLNPAWLRIEQELLTEPELQVNG